MTSGIGVARGRNQLILYQLLRTPSQHIQQHERNKQSKGSLFRSHELDIPFILRLLRSAFASTMLRTAVVAAALASAAAFAPISAPTGLQLRTKNVARAPRAGEPGRNGRMPCRLRAGLYVALCRGQRPWLHMDWMTSVELCASDPVAHGSGLRLACRRERGSNSD